MKKIIILFLLLATTAEVLVAQQVNKKAQKTAKTSQPETKASLTAPEPEKSKWISCGLSEKTINTLSVSRTNKDLIFATNDDEGIYRTTNGGEMWELVDKVKEVSAIISERMRGMVFYAITPRSILISEDEGKTFRELFIAEGRVDFKITCMSFDESPTTTAKAMLFGTTKGVYKSLDRGKTFLTAGLEDTHINSLAVSVRDGEKPVIYAATKNGVYISQNYGLSWRALSEGIPQTNILQIVTDFKKPENVYAVTEEYGIYRSTNNGANWVGTADKIPQLNGFRLTSTINSLTNRSVIYMTNYSGETYLTEDDGVSWKKVGEKLDIKDAVGLCISMANVSPTTLFVGTLKGVFKYNQ